MSPTADESDVAYCADSCGRVATTERLTGIIVTGGGLFAELVELVCVDCEREPSEAHRIDR